MADYQDLYGFIFVLLAIGMLLGVGVLCLDAFGTAVRATGTIDDESVAIAGSAGVTAFTDTVSATYFGNSSINCNLPNSGCANITSAGVISVNSSFQNGTYQVDYTYKADSQGTTTLTNARTAVSPIATTWLPLLVTIFVLAIILKLVIGSFGGQR